MKLKYAILHIALFSILVSCSHPESNNACLLKRAESLMQTSFDSALHILNTHTDISNMNEADKAKYALLLTQALDKNYIHHQNDSLITIAIEYYKHSRDNNLKAKVYFYLGRVYQDNNEYTKATEAYLTALKMQATDKDIQ